jgi:N2-acetyl-L-2,4-diaminobutanoate deacetylase
MVKLRPPRVGTDVDFDKNGKQVSYLRVPNSRNESGWGTLLMPIAVIKNGTGPTILFSGGNHGDEYEGPVALMKLIRTLRPRDISGRIIVVPGLNFPALMAGTRLSPIDGRNMNRTFPGDRNGTITQVIADYVYRELVPMADAVYDLHSGGYSMFMMPSVMVHYLPNKKQMRDTVEAMKAFRAPVGLIIEELDTEGMLDTAVEELGKVFVGAELGGGAVLTPESVGVAETGIRNVLKHFGMMRGKPETPEWRGRRESRLMETPDGSCFTMATADGLYEPFVELRDEVKKGQALGQIHFADALDRDPLVVRAKTAGTLYCRRAPGKTFKGDTLAVLAKPVRNMVTVVR